jgi:cAMP-dependent protein kinase regulator
MSLPEAYKKEIKALEDQILQSNPTDILQFCADYFLSRLASQRVNLVSPDSTSKVDDDLPPKQTTTKDMSSPFGVFGANANPFGSSEGTQTAPKRIHSVIEEDETENVTSPTTPSFGATTGAAPQEKFAHPFGGDAYVDEPPTSLRSPPNPDTYPPQYNFGRRTSVSAESLKPSADTSDNWSPPVHKKSPEQLKRLQKAIENNFLFSHLDEEQGAQILGALVEKPIPAKDIKVRALPAGDAF